MSRDPSSIPRPEGRYVVCDEIAAGGTATVHFGRLLGNGFSRTVAIKRLHPTYARDPAFVGMFLDEARLAARIRHPNVCTILDVATLDDVPCLVLEYVHGEPLSKHIDAAVAADALVPYEIATAIVCGMLQGLHAAHEATDDVGEPLQLIHRDVSPQNVLVGTDGVPRVVDFGMAKAIGRVQNTEEGQLKGKIGYMAPEQFALDDLDRRVDVYSAAVVLWETLTGQFLFKRSSPGKIMHAILNGEVNDPRSVVPDIPAELAAVCLKGLSRDPAERFATAHEMAVAIESAVLLPSPREVGAWVEQVAGDVLRARATVLARIEAEHPSVVSIPSPTPGPGEIKPIKEPLKRPRRKIVALLVGVAAVLGLLVYFGFHEPPAPTISSNPASSPVVSESETSEPPRATPEASASASARSSVPIKPAWSPAPTSCSKPKPKSVCDPPYTVDAEGIRRPKRQCLELSPKK